MNAVTVTVCLLLTAASSASQAQETLPADVARYVVRRDLCDHFRGEEPYDAERRTFLKRSMRRYCTGTDARLATLKRKYRARSEVMSKLGEYDENIEAP